MTNQLPLKGITVVSIEQAVAAPFATRQLADLGARVIKIERDTGDFARTYDTTVGGDASYFVWLNRTKESVVLDLKSNEGTQQLANIIRKADVFVSNLAPGAIERLGFGAEACKKLNDQLIHVSISGYGEGGSYSARKAYDLIIQCESGLLSTVGTPDTPSKVGISIADIATGMYAYSGILSALLLRSQTGKGSKLELSMLEAIGEWMSQPLLFSVHSGSVPTRTGARHASIAPYGPFDTKDGTVFFGIQNEREWANFCSTILRDTTLIKDPRFKLNANRKDNQDVLYAIIEGSVQSFTSDQLTSLLDSIGIANARMRNMLEFNEHPQLRQRNRWKEVKTSTGSTAKVLIPPAMPNNATPQWGDVPQLGEHTNSVLSEFSRSSM